MVRDAEGTIRFDAHDEQEVVSALKEIFNTTEIGQDYAENFRTEAKADDDANLILNAAVRVAGGFQICAHDLGVALALLIENGQIRPRNFKPAIPFEEPVEVKRDKL